MEFLERLVDALPYAVCVVDSTSRKIKLFNKIFTAQILTGDHLMGADFAQEILKFEDKAKFIAAFDAAISTDEVVTVGCCQSLSNVGSEKTTQYKAYIWVLHRLDDCNVMVRGNLDIPKSPDFLDFSAELMDFFQNAPVALLWLSDTGHILWANDLELETLGYTREELVGQHITQICFEEKKPIIDMLTEQSCCKNTRNLPIRLRAKNGEIKYLAVDSNVNWNLDGTFKHMCCFFRDDADRRVREAEQEMAVKTHRAARQIKDRFIRRIFHELKTPLHIISGCASELSEELERVQGSQAATNEVTMIQHQIDGMLGTLDDVSFSIQFDEGRSIQPLPRPTDISALLRSVVSGVEAIESRSGQRIMFQIIVESIPRCVEADASLKKVLFHLLRNAVRFSPNEANVRLHAVFTEVGGDIMAGKRRRKLVQSISNLSFPRSRLGSLSIAVTNSVREPVDLEVINQGFHNYCSVAPLYGDGDNDLTSVQGIGLGLYVAFMLVQGMGGRLAVTSGEGDVTFSFKLQLSALDDTLGDTVKAMQFVNNRESQQLNQQQHSIVNELEPMMGITDPFRKQVTFLAIDSDVVGIDCFFTSNESLRPQPRGIDNYKGSDESATKATTSATHSALTWINDVDWTTSGPSKSDYNCFLEAPTPLARRVLVVDDSPMCQRVLCRILEKNGYSADTADNGQDLCDKLLSVDPCVYCAILMDLRMPIMDGLSATRRIRDTPHLQRMPVIVVTAELNEEIRTMALQAGAQEVLSKPVHAGDIIYLLSKYNNSLAKGVSSPYDSNSVTNRKRSSDD